jgi:hypothetical protein
MTLTIPVRLAIAAAKAGVSALSATRRRSDGGARITRDEAQAIGEGLARDARRILRDITDDVDGSAPRRGA